MRKALIAALALLASPLSAQTLNSQLSGDLVPTHDPVITREGDTYYVFGTGVPGIPGATSCRARRRIWCTGRRASRCSTISPNGR
jgi:beta-xylosidase